SATTTLPTAPSSPPTEVAPATAQPSPAPSAEAVAQPQAKASASAVAARTAPAKPAGSKHDAVTRPPPGKVETIRHFGAPRCTFRLRTSFWWYRAAVRLRFHSLMRSCRWGWLAAGVALCPGSALAQATAEEKVAAEALFDEGKKMLAEGQLPAACEKLEASQ